MSCRPLSAPSSSSAAGPSLVAAVRAAAPAAEAVLVRDPVEDRDAPASADIDLLAFEAIDDIVPERVWRPGERPLDLLRLPAAWLDCPERLARHGLVAHRLCASVPLLLTTDRAKRGTSAAARYAEGTEARRERIAGFFEMASLAVREVGVTWDFPPLASFWLQMAYAASLAALGDALSLWCPNVYTRPFSPAGLRPRPPASASADRVWETLRLDGGAARLVAPIERLQKLTSRYPEPVWPERMRAATRAEFRYFRSGEELRWRVSVACELEARGASQAAVWYLRFWAYALARLPMVHACAAEGLDVSFLRPERAVAPALAQGCPDILDALAGVLQPVRPIAATDVIESFEALCAWRAELEAILEDRGLRPNAGPWLPWKPAPAHEDARLATVHSGRGATPCPD